MNETALVIAANGIELAGERRPVQTCSMTFVEWFRRLALIEERMQRDLMHKIFDSWAS